ncbi:unnamed protein product [Penicillium salamii]|nr:unnamed protein product [Penicillium salamii]
MAHFVKSTVLGGNFETPERYVDFNSTLSSVSIMVLRRILQIYRSKDPENWSFRSCLVNQQYVAVKKILNPFATPATAQSLFREIKLLKRLRHDNECCSMAVPLWIELTMEQIISPVDIFISPAEDIYLVTDLMQTDLRTLIESKSIGDEFVPFLLYQMLRGLKYLHSASIPHGDLRPESILINQNCDLKICDLGLPGVQETHTMSYIATRCYRAPELLLTCQSYDEKVDVWSAGCIFAEMLQGRPLFAGRNHVEQFCAMTELLGTPSDDLLARIASQSTVHFIQSLPYCEGTGLSNMNSNFDSTALNLLERMLVFDRNERISASDALAALYLAAYHDPTDEPIADHIYDWSIHERWGSNNTLKMELYDEIIDYHKQSEIRQFVKNWAQSTSGAQC